MAEGETPPLGALESDPRMATGGRVVVVKVHGNVEEAPP